jgi:hypothetical protein
MKVTIAFPSLLKLWSFTQVLYKRPVQISFLKKRITCFCTETEINLASLLYQAKVEPAR